MSTCIAFVSPLGGTGQTTLVATLAHLWAQQRACLVVELNTQNGLGAHCGLEQAPQQGWLQCVEAGQWWGDAVLENSGEVKFLPFGPAATSLDGLALLQRHMLQDPDWLGKQLQELEFAPDGVVLLDVALWPGAMALQALQCADLVVLTLEASPRAVAAHLALKGLLAQARPGVPSAMVFSRFNPRRKAQAQSLLLLRQQWLGQLSPYILHDDESVPMALRQGQCVTSWAPQSQSAHDFQGISQWLLGQFAAPGSAA